MGNEKRLTIAVILGDTYTEYAKDLIKGFYTCAQREQVNLIFLMRSSLPRDTNGILSNMTGEDFQVHFSSIYDYVPLIKPDVLILAYGSLSIFSDTPAKEDLFAYFEGIPCLLLKDISDNPEIPYLVADNYSGMRECIRHLVEEHNYKKVAFLAGPANNHDSNERLRAYHDVMNENGLEVTDTMVAFGDYSETVDAQVEYLLDSNPGLEAIAFANDNMAKAGYRVCGERGIVVGRDLAITGFDDVNMAKELNPPLTSVMHNSFLFSYQALQNAIQLCNGGKAFYSKLPAKLHTRASCGCNTYGKVSFKQTTDEEISALIHEKITYIVEDYFFSMPYIEAKHEYAELLFDFFDSIIDPVFKNSTENQDFKQHIPYLKKLCGQSHVAPMIMQDHLVNVMRSLIACAPEGTIRSALLSILASTQKYVYSTEVMGLQAFTRLNLHQNWFVNSFTQDLMTSEMKMEECLARIMNRLKLMKIKSCYFFLRLNPIESDQSYKLKLPEDIYLAAYYNDDTMVQMKRPDWMHITGKNGLTDILPTDRAQFLTTYVLVSGNTQYGFLLCENEPEDISFVLACSLQIGAFLRFNKLNENERLVKEELEVSLRLIKEQNNILNFISEYDELTKLLNRRGFIEKTLHAINANDGKTAYILFGDLDHLKEINDSFGHSEGDFALIKVADYLRECLPADAVTARIGGDEFVSFMVSEEEDFDTKIKLAIQQYSSNYNKFSDKPYYIEISIGIYKYQCRPAVSIADLLHESDTLLYAAKAYRRVTAKK